MNGPLLKSISRAVQGTFDDFLALFALPHLKIDQIA